MAPSPTQGIVVYRHRSYMGASFNVTGDLRDLEDVRGGDWYDTDNSGFGNLGYSSPAANLGEKGEETCSIGI